MANIKTHLNNIKGALYGKDVRNSIHDAIEQCYTDASINGNANMEVTQARGEYETLGERLDDHASQLAHKANNVELEVERQRIDLLTKIENSQTIRIAESIISIGNLAFYGNIKISVHILPLIRKHFGFKT